MKELFKNQKEAIEISLKNDFASGVHFHATGTGKSWISFHIVLEYIKQYPKNNILWICEQKSILNEQFSRSTLKERGFDFIFQHFLVFQYSERKEKDWPKILQMAQIWKKPIFLIINRAYLTYGKKYEALKIPFSLIIHDECHSIQNHSTQLFYKWMNQISEKENRKISYIGFSATPILDYFPFTNILSSYSIYDAFLDGRIVSPKIQWLKYDESNVSQDVLIEWIYNEMQYLPYQKIIVWCGMIEHCSNLLKKWKELFEKFSQMKNKKDEYYFTMDTSQSSKQEEENIKIFYEKKEKAILFCANKHREGSDIPYLDGCIFLDKVEERNSKTFIQCMGRVLRLDPNKKKTFGWILDLKANSTMEILNRIQPFLFLKNKQKDFLPWKTSLKVETMPFEHKIYELNMILPNLDSSQSNIINEEYENITSKDIPKYFSRKIDDIVYYDEIKKNKYEQRLNEELELLEKKKLFPYLIRALIILQKTKDKHIPHVTRGSCGSSLVCYLLGISHVDPVKYNISFARFLNEYRDTLPDIDYDFPYHIRDEVFLQLEKMYPGKIARISNPVHFHDKSAFRESLRKVGGIRSFIGKYDLQRVFKTLPKEKQKAVLERKKQLENTFRCYSLHCGGIIYYHDGVPQDKVLEKKHSSVLQQVIYNKEDISREKQFKIDILSSRGLAIVYEVFSFLKKEIEFNLEYNDINVYKMLGNGDNIGITLAESPLMRKTFLKHKPKNLDDLAKCLAIIRPMAKNALYKENEENEENEETHPEFIFDDDVITYISKIFECSEADADKCRRIFSKHDEKGMEEWKQKLDVLLFKSGEKEKIWKSLQQLSKYSFCKSHAYSYAQLVYQLAYLKYYYPFLFWKSVIKHSESSYKKWVHIFEASRYDIHYIKEKNRNGCSIYAENRRKKIHDIIDPLQQLKTFGYWIPKNIEKEKVFPGTFIECIDEKLQQYVFSGLIASYRILNRGSKALCILCLCVGPGKYIEVHLQKVEYLKEGIVGCKVKNGYTMDKKCEIYGAKDFTFF